MVINFWFQKTVQKKIQRIIFKFIVLGFSMLEFMEMNSILLANQDVNSKFSQQDLLDILTDVDKVRGPQNKSFVMDITARSFRNKKLDQTVTLKSYVEVETSPNNWMTLVRFLSPASRKGRFLLLTDNKMYYYKKGTRKSIRISPAQRIIGEASNLDVSGVNYREFYSIEGYEVESLENNQVIRLDLKKNKITAAYHSIKLWVAMKNHFPIKAEFYSRSGKRLKYLFYRKAKKILGRKRPSQMVIVDALNEKKVTYIDINDMKHKRLASSYYNNAALPQIKF